MSFFLRKPFDQIYISAKLEQMLFLYIFSTQLKQLY